MKHTRRNPVRQHMNIVTSYEVKGNDKVTTVSVCSACNGDGELMVHQSHLEESDAVYVACHHCGGFGYV